MTVANGGLEAILRDLLDEYGTQNTNELHQKVHGYTKRQVGGALHRLKGKGYADFERSTGSTTDWYLL